MFSKILFYFSVLFLFQACDSAVDFNSDSSALLDSPVAGNGDPTEGAPKTLLTPLPPETIDKHCDNSVNKTAKVVVHFPKPDKTCAWGLDGNLDKKDAYFQARIEQRVELNLPANSIICDAKMEFKKQDFHYDDHFMMLFNKSVIAASYDFTSRFDTQVYGLLEYDWSKMKGMPWDASKELIYCPQIAGATAHCAFPGHDKQGFVELEYDSSYVRTIMSNGIPSQHSFSLISIGDNDTFDCEHEDLEFVVSLKYVQLEP